MQQPNRFLGRTRSVLVHAGKGFGFGSRKDTAQKLCPCGSGLDYQACCQRYHANNMLQKAPTAEATLRARFSAYAKKEWKYVVRTTHPDNPNTKGSVSADGKIRTTFEEDIKVSMYNFEFVKLEVLGVEQGAGADEAVIECRVHVLQKLDDKAKKLDKPIPRVIQERSRFVRSDGAWEFIGTVDTNWSRDKLDYLDSPEQQQQQQPAVKA